MCSLTPCPTCKDRDCCVVRSLTEREAIFAWSYGASFGCEDYREDSFRGIEGVVDAASLDRVSGGVVSGQRGRHVDFGFVCDGTAIR